jgi:hypothetical protein
MVRKKNIKLRSDLDYYGASYIASEYCNFPRTLNPNRIVVWQHGWLPAHLNIHPYLLLPGNYSNNTDIVALVARKDQQKYLSDAGYKNVVAVGTPIVYTQKLSVKRKPNTLLVMPVHSLDYTSHNHWSFKEYAKQIHDLRHEFDEVVICIHPSCVKKGYWVEEFKAYNFKIVEGSDIYDRNALYRMQELLSSYEYVTTNGFGSHLSYAAYFGAKVSIYGDFAEFKEEDFINDPFYTKFPEILQPTLNLFSEKAIKEHFSELFVFPKDAEQRVEWGKSQLGEDNKVSPKKLKELLGWNLNILMNSVTEKNELSKKVYNYFKNMVRPIIEK